MTKLIINAELPYRGTNKRYPYEVKVAACADYLLGMPVTAINYKHGISINSTIVQHWIKLRGCFKLRQGNE